MKGFYNKWRHIFGGLVAGFLSFWLMSLVAVPSFPQCILSFATFMAWAGYFSIFRD
jgi:hypothetical protein